MATNFEQNAHTENTQIGITAISNCSGLKSHSASEIATRIASESVEMSVEIATEIAAIQIAAISGR